MEYINFLLSEELKFEIRIRDAEPKATQECRRKQLRVLLKHRGIELPSDIVSPYPFSEDLEEMKNSLASLREELSKLAADTFSTTYKRLLYRISHVSTRLRLSQPQDESQVSEKQQIENDLMSLEEDFYEKEECLQLNALSLNPSNPATVTISSVPAPGHSAAVTPVSPNYSSISHVPVWKWNVFYSGDTKESLTDFLERISELRVARNASYSELFSSAVDIFRGPALIWFRNIKHTVHDWFELEKLLRDTFLPSDYYEDLLSEIKKRTQGEKENVTLFIAQMQGLFAKLSPIPEESEQIRIIRRNLLPYFLGQLSLHDISSLSELSSLCKQLDETRIHIENYRPPSRRVDKVMEVSLACSFPISEDGNENSQVCEVNPSSSICSTPNSTYSRIVCWNCRSNGHRYNQCKQTRIKFCFGCGNQGVTKSSCSKCSQKN